MLLMWNMGMTAVRTTHFKFNSFTVTDNMKQAAIVVS